jgi:hypothetical protein
VHGVEGKAELGAIVGDALIRVEDLLELRLVALVSGVGLSYAIECQAAQFLEIAGMLLLKGSPAFEEAGEVLRSVLAHLNAAEPTWWLLTLALAMLALRRFSRVETPTSECKTSCTRCCVCAS